MTIIYNLVVTDIFNPQMNLYEAFAGFLFWYVKLNHIGPVRDKEHRSLSEAASKAFRLFTENVH